MTTDRFSRTEMLVGAEGLDLLKNAKVAVFGVGGVGSFTVEALTRAGIGELTLIDFDEVDITNLNRQLHATTETVGEPKVALMKARIESINPQAEVIVHQMKYNSETAATILSDDWDYVVDAIDMVSSKLDLIERCTEKGIPIISCMGTGNKLDPTRFKVTDIYKTSICPLARVMRRELKKRNIKKLKVIYSDEQPLTPVYGEGHDHEARKQPPGSIAFVPSVAGLIIASQVVRDLLEKS